MVPRPAVVVGPVAVTMLLVGLLAALHPALMASRTDPAVPLREPREAEPPETTPPDCTTSEPPLDTFVPKITQFNRLDEPSKTQGWLAAAVAVRAMVLPPTT